MRVMAVAVGDEDEIMAGSFVHREIHGGGHDAIKGVLKLGFGCVGHFLRRENQMPSFFAFAVVIGQQQLRVKLGVKRWEPTGKLVAAHRKFHPREQQERRKAAQG